MSTKRRLRIASYGNNVGVKDMIRLRQIEEYNNYLKKQGIQPYKYQKEDPMQKTERIEEFNKTYLEKRNPAINKKTVSPIGGENTNSYKANFNEIKHIFNKNNPRMEDKVFAHSLRSYNYHKDGKIKRSVTQYQPTRFTERVDFTQSLNKTKTLIDIKPQGTDSLSNYDHILRPRVGLLRDSKTVDFMVNLRNYEKSPDLEKNYSNLPYVQKKGILPYKDSCSIPLYIDQKQYKEIQFQKQQKLQELKQKYIQQNKSFK